MAPERDIADEAAVWLARRDRGLRPEEKRALAAWRAADPKNAAELDRIEAVWLLFDDPKAARRLAGASAAIAPAPRSWNSELWPVWVGAIAAAVVLLCWVALPRERRPAALREAAAYRVLPAEARNVTLADGTRVEMRGDSEVRTEFTASLRRVVLARGEAHFEVAKDPVRPFVVSAGSMAVRDVGTIFDVELRSSEVEVLVTEGKVTVEDGSGSQFPPAVPLLVAGQRALIFQDASGRPSRVTVEPVTPTGIEQALAWESTWLVFDRTPLDKAVEAFNLHSPRRLVIGDSSLRDRRLGGMFRADNVEGFVRLLEESLDVKSVRTNDGGFLLLPEH